MAVANNGDKPGSREYEKEYMRARKGEFHSCYICYGKDRSSMYEFVKWIQDLLIPEGDREFAVSRHDMRDTPVQDAIMDAETFPFLVSRKLVIIENAFFFTTLDKKASTSSDEDGDGDEDEQSESQGKNTWTKVENHDLNLLSEYFLNPAEFSVVLFLVPGQKLDERKKLVTSLTKPNPNPKRQPKSLSLLAFEPLTKEYLMNWVETNVRKRGLQFAPDMLDYFIDLNGTDKAVLRHELDKLFLCMKQESVISKDMIDSLGVKTFEQNVFQMIEMVMKKQIGKAHELLLDLYKYPKENSPFLILNLIARQYRMMLIIKELSAQNMNQGQIAGVVGASPYAIKLWSADAKRLSTDEIADVLMRCADLDYAFKSGRVEPKIALELLLLRLAS